MNLIQQAQKIANLAEKIELSKGQIFSIVLLSGAAIIAGVTYTPETNNDDICDRLRVELKQGSLAEKVDIYRSMENINCEAFTWEDVKSEKGKIVIDRQL